MVKKESVLQSQPEKGSIFLPFKTTFQVSVCCGGFNQNHIICSTMKADYAHYFYFASSTKAQVT